jgi:putative Mn2+ efflux pump MntP
MPILEVLALAVGLGADAMSVCTAVGVRWHGPRQKFRLAWHMGLFQFFMPVLGWLGGQRAAALLKDFGRYAAAGLVMAVGAKMLYEALRSRPGSMAEGVEQAAEGALRLRRSDPTRGWSLVALSIATSVDALVVGFSLGLRGRGIWQASILIGLVAALMALVGVNLGQRAGAAFGRHAETAGAVVLIGLGVAFLWL